MNKHNLWFLTLFSFILVLGVYYITMPSDLLEKVQEEIEENNQAVIEEVVEENVLQTMRIDLEEERQETMNVLQEQLVDEKLTTEEKNNVYEQLKYLNEVQGKEESLEKKIKKELELDCFIKIDNTNVQTVCIAEEHNEELANKIMRMIQKEYEERKNISVKFQKK